MNKDYKIICDEDWTEVERLVNEAISEGLRPLGSPFTFIQKNDKGEDQLLICQAMIIAVLQY